MDWTELKIEIDASQADTASAIAQMVVPYGIYIEDYSSLEQEAMEIAKIDLIDEDLLKKDRSKAIIHIYLPPHENPGEATAFLTERFTAEGIVYNISAAICKNQDWENNWKAYFKSLKVGSRLLIHPVWDDDFDPEGRTVIDIEPGLAFGSGGHDTTKLCLCAVEENIKEGMSVLDIGCGSGILAIAALLLGAESATAIDIDPLAVKRAEENAALNKIDPAKFTAVHGDLTEKITGRFDMITANIVADVIIKLCEQIGSFMSDGAVFIASGIIKSREEDVLPAFKKAGLEICSRIENNDWLCFTLKKA